MRENKLMGIRLTAIRDRLNSTGIPWVIFAGAAAYCYGSLRKITDVDILVCCRDLEKARAVLRETDLEGFDVGKGAEIKIDRAICRFFLEDVPAERIERRKLFDVEVPVIPVEDNIIFKAMMQRGKDQGKHDIEDIRRMLRHEKIDLEYLRTRIDKCECGERVKPILQKFIANL